MLELGVRRDKLSVLLIDDDLVSREVTATVLTMDGYIVHTADDGVRAVEMLAAGEVAPDLILMDAQMPGLSGADLIAELRARSHARIVALSGSNPPADVTAAADGFLLKPLDVAVLGKFLAGQPAGPVSIAAILADPDAPAISPDTLAQLRHMMPESGVREIYQAIVTDLLKRTLALDAAIAAHDGAEVRRIGHAIKGGCAMAGALQAARIGALLEIATLDFTGNQSDNIASLLNDLRSATSILQRMLEAELPA
ncbi:MAG TPA: response regulator [Terracidiphilus sp.]|nr:response regulator [Terracidiphilus sp.]